MPAFQSKWPHRECLAIRDKSNFIPFVLTKVTVDVVGDGGLNPSGSANKSTGISSSSVVMEYKTSRHVRLFLIRYKIPIQPVYLSYAFTKQATPARTHGVGSSQGTVKENTFCSREGFEYTGISNLFFIIYDSCSIHPK